MRSKRNELIPSWNPNLGPIDVTHSHAPTTLLEMCNIHAIGTVLFVRNEDDKDTTVYVTMPKVGLHELAEVASYSLIDYGSAFNPSGRRTAIWTLYAGELESATDLFVLETVQHKGLETVIFRGLSSAEFLFIFGRKRYLEIKAGEE